MEVSRLLLHAPTVYPRATQMSNLCVGCSGPHSQQIHELYVCVCVGACVRACAEIPLHHTLHVWLRLEFLVIEIITRKTA
jgi:hypothetical protein